MEINTQPFHDQLNILQKYIELKILLTGHGYWKNLRVCSPEYYQTHYLPPEEWVSLELKQTFDEFYTIILFNAQTL